MLTSGFINYSVFQMLPLWLLNCEIVSVPAPCPCSARATTCKPQEIYSPTLVSRWTPPPFIPRPSALATRATCAPSAPSVRLAASARWVSNTCITQRQHLDTSLRAYISLYIVALCWGQHRGTKHPREVPWLLDCRAGVSNIRLRSQNQLGKDSNPAY